MAQMCSATTARCGLRTRTDEPPASATPIEGKGGGPARAPRLGRDKSSRHLTSRLFQSLNAREEGKEKKTKKTRQFVILSRLHRMPNRCESNCVVTRKVRWLHSGPSRNFIINDFDIARGDDSMNRTNQTSGAFIMHSFSCLFA